MNREKMHRGLLALGLSAIIFIGFLVTALYVLPSIWTESSTSPHDISEPQNSETQHETENVALRVNLYLKGEEWRRDSKTDLPVYDSIMIYHISNHGTTTAESVQVTISIDGTIFQQFSLSSLLPQNSFSDEFTVSISYDNSKQISLTASSQGSKDTASLVVNASLQRSFDSAIAKLYINPNDSTVQQTLKNIVKNPLIPDWIEIRDWVANNIKYRYDNVTHGESEYWQLPKETLALKTGDCEDYSILLCSFYRAIGWDEKEVYVVLGEGNGYWHAWVKLDVDIIGWQNIEPQAGALFTFVGDFLYLSGYTAEYNFNDVSLLRV